MIVPPFAQVGQNVAKGLSPVGWVTFNATEFLQPQVALYTRLYRQPRYCKPYHRHYARDFSKSSLKLSYSNFIVQNCWSAVCSAGRLQRRLGSNLEDHFSSWLMEQSENVCWREDTVDTSRIIGYQEQSHLLRIAQAVAIQWILTKIHLLKKWIIFSLV